MIDSRKLTNASKTSKRASTVPLPPKLPVPYSVRSEEARKERKKRLEQKNKEKKKPLRSGRIKTEEKIAKAKRHEDAYPIGVDPSTCSLSHVRPIVRIEAGQALWVAYTIYRAPNGRYGVVPGALGRSEFGLEIILAIAYQVNALGLSFDKAIALQKFFQNLEDFDGSGTSMGQTWDSGLHGHLMHGRLALRRRLSETSLIDGRRRRCRYCTDAVSDPPTPF